MYDNYVVFVWVLYTFLCHLLWQVSFRFPHQVAKSKITTAGTYVPPKSHPPGSAQPQPQPQPPQPTAAVASQSVSAHKQQQATPSQSHQQQVSTTGIFMPPNGSDDGM